MNTKGFLSRSHLSIVLKIAAVFSLLPLGGCFVGGICSTTAVTGKTVMESEYQRVGGSLFERMGSKIYGASEAKITFEKLGSSERYDITADREGKFRINLPKGKYRVHSSWGEGANERKWKFDVEISGCWQDLNAGTWGLGFGGGYKDESGREPVK